MSKVESPKRILVVKLSAIGDVLMATPVARTLRKKFPDAYIAWAVERKSADVVIGNQYLDEIIVIDRKKTKNLLGDALRFIGMLVKLRKEFKSRKFDVSLDLQGLIRSAVVCRISGARRCIGFSDAGECGTVLYDEKYTPDSGNLNAQQRNLDLLKMIGVNSNDTAMDMPLSDEDRAFAERFFSENNLNGEKVVALLPATTWVNKHWVAEQWSKVIDILAEKYNTRCVIMGSKADIPLASHISDNANVKPTISAGQTTLKQAGAVMDKCNAVIGVDTGLLHMAVALKKPTVGLFGASAWHCFLKRDDFTWVAKEFACSPCYRHPTCKDVDCMRAIEPEDVENAVKRWL